MFLHILQSTENGKCFAYCLAESWIYSENVVNVAKQKQWQYAMESLWENILRCYLNRKYMMQGLWHICNVLHMAKALEYATMYVKEKLLKLRLV